MSEGVNLVHVDGSGPGLRRERAGKGWRYLRPDGTEETDPAERARVDALAVPPAWRDVWIAPDPRAHLQATGIDAAGRKQYRYHPAFREERDHAKFEDMLAFGAAMPRLRARVAGLLATDGGLGRERVLAAALRLLDLGLFRVGSEHSVAQYHHYGLTTLTREHVKVDGERVSFYYVAKAGVRRRLELSDAPSAAVLGALRRRRGGPEQLLAHRDRRRRWLPVHSEEVNDFLRAQAEGYIDPRVFARFRAGRVIALPDGAETADPWARRERTERAVLDLISETA
jgi:DNA topoisomerase IB